MISTYQCLYGLFAETQIETAIRSLAVSVQTNKFNVQILVIVWHEKSQIKDFVYDKI